MRRHVPTVRRRRLTSLFSERDTLGLALPGLVCGLIGIGLVLWAQAPIAHARDVAKKERAAQIAALRSAALANVGSGVAPVGSNVALVDSSVAAVGSSEPMREGRRP